MRYAWWGVFQFHKILSTSTSICRSALAIKCPSPRMDSTACYAQSLNENPTTNEALTMNTLDQECYPKSRTLFDKPSFRMQLLDLCAEWTLGMRPSYPLTGHWVLKFDK